MRDWIDSIFAFIGAESITDEEYESLNLTGIEVLVYNQTAYNEFSRILAARELVSDVQKRLLALFQAKGFDPEPLKVERSQIFIGAPLCS